MHHRSASLCGLVTLGWLLACASDPPDAADDTELNPATDAARDEP